LAEQRLAQPVELESPRVLTTRERAVIEHLLAHPLAKPELGAQAGVAMVKAVCSCGCPSVWLAVDESMPRARYEESETREGRTDHVALTAFQRKARGVTETTLHVIDGRLFELEIWADEGVRPQVAVSRLEYA
jgi:hypothetical protein